MSKYRMRMLRLLGGLSLGLAAALVLGGCAGTGHAAVAQSPGAVLDWPTPDLPTIEPTHTPFPIAVFTPSAALKQAQVASAAADGATTGTPGASAPAVPVPVPTATMTATQGVAGQVRTDSVNLRQGPGTGYPVLGTLYPGDGFTALATDPTHGWLLVQAAGQQGWLSVGLVALGEGAAGLPVQVPAGATPAAPTQAPISLAETAPLPALAQPPPGTPQPTPAAQGAPPANAAASAGPSGLPTPAGRGKLVFQTSSGGAIMIIDADGSGLRQLTTGMDPALSWDGKQVAFTRWQGVTGSVWVIDVDGSNVRQVADHLRKAKGAEWSPDGRYIVVNYQHEGWVDPHSECMPYSPGTYPPYGAYDFSVEVGAGGALLCFMMPPDEHWSLHTIDLTRGDHGEDLYGGMYAFRPAWDPTKAWRIVCEAGNGLLETSVNGDYKNYLTGVVEDKAPAFSPDGQYIAFTERSNSGSRYDIYRINSDGSGRVRLTDIPLWQTVGPDKIDPPHNLSPAWSPDGRQIAFITDRTGRWEIWAMAPDGSGQQPLFAGQINDQIQIHTDYVNERVISWH